MNTTVLERKGRPRRSGAACVLAALAPLSGCFGPSQIEIQEGLRLARLFARLAPEAQALTVEEGKLAHELRLMLDEAEHADFNSGDVDRFRGRFQAALTKLVSIRDRRVALEVQVRQATATTALVDAVQKDAIEFFQEQIGRDSGWLQLAANMRLRKELGRTQNFPELGVLKQQLDLFSGELQDAALAGQIETLRIEYGFSDEDLHP